MKSAVDLADLAASPVDEVYGHRGEGAPRARQSCDRNAWCRARHGDGKLIVKPRLGFTNGVLLSTADVNDDGATGGNVGDGIVPSLTVNYAGEKLEAEWYSGYYAALRNRGDDGTLDFLHLWANGGYRFSPYVSAGVHFEWLENTVNEGGDGATVYQWLGPYLQFSLPDQGFFARFSAGADIEDDSAGDFYKLTVGMSF